MSDLAQRNGEVVSLRCRNSTYAEQHPGDIDTVQTYVELVDGNDRCQIVLVGNQSFSCPGVMRVIGQVDVVDLGGPAGTKGEYSRPWVAVHRFECEAQ